MKATEFFDVCVTTLTRESDCVVSLQLRDPLNAALPPWDAGSHVDVMLPNGLVRQYSLCSEPEADHWRLGVLRERSGRGGSAYVHDELKPGTKVQVRGPRNNFALAPAPEYVFIAGGIGITPILPMIRQVELSGVPWRLVYFGLAGLLGRSATAFHLYTCGPGPLLKAIQNLTDHWEDQSRFHFERFVADPADAGLAAAPVAGDHAFTVELTDGQEVEVPVGTTILAALEGAGLPVLSSCQEGICGTCETGVLSGEIDHRDSLLSEDERAAMDTMMICVSRCRGKRLLLDL